MKTYFAINTMVLFLFTACAFGQGKTASPSSGGELSKGISVSESASLSNSGWGVAVKVSTLGPGLEVVKAFDFPVILRLGGTWVRYSHDVTTYISSSDQNKTVANIQLGSVSLMADWQFVGFMHLTAGAIYNLSEWSVDSYSNDVVYIGEIEVTPETMGYTSTSVYTSKINPYLGIGLGRSISKSHLVGFGVDLGVVYIGSPKVNLSANGMLQPTAEAITTSDGTIYNKDIIENNISTYKFYPMVNFQLSFRLTGKNSNR